jgi:SET domain-containing protein
LIALRDIRLDEELTIDYGSFANPDAAPFACSCGMENCRGTIRGSS